MASAVSRSGVGDGLGRVELRSQIFLGHIPERRPVARRIAWHPGSRGRGPIRPWAVASFNLYIWGRTPSPESASNLSIPGGLARKSGRAQEPGVRARHAQVGLELRKRRHVAQDVGRVEGGQGLDPLVSDVFPA